MSCGDIHRLIIALCIPPLGFFSKVGLSQDFFWISLVIYPFAVNGLYFRRVASHCD
ncbi:YqaE/Pmp3 family membrane protein [Synechococcus sp. CC9605]|uniref:YqaE/Pmp3 family membrane protein n=1 Tax=Synechococcus sp. (strain CC9605) TaxID=110662 RepID=UPI002152D97E|nr:YqaE/Pmp3 family membrane protein [Synechococcus sp. CC9605]